MNTVAIIGANSAIGKSLSLSLSQSKKFEVIEVSRKENGHESPAFDIRFPETAKNIEFRAAPETVIYLSHAPIGAFDGNITRYVSHNLEFTFNAIEEVQKLGCKHLFFASSASVYGTDNSGPITEDFDTNPTTPYSKLKLATEKMLSSEFEDAKMSFSALRIFNIYGAGMPNSLINKLQTASSVNPITLQGPETFIRDYLHVDDLASTIRELVSLERAIPSIVNVGSGVPISNKALLEKLPQKQKEFVTCVPSRFNSSVADVSLLKSLCNPNSRMISFEIAEYDSERF